MIKAIQIITIIAATGIWQCGFAQQVNLEVIHNYYYEDNGADPPWDYSIGYNGTPKASSTLSGQGSSNYGVENLADGNFKTAWVEGKDDYGVGEWVEFAIDTGGADGDQWSGFSGRLTILNGYCKSEKSWGDNSRVKSFQVYVNGSKLCTIKLNDTHHAQLVDISSFLDLSGYYLSGYYGQDYSGYLPETSNPNGMKINIGDKIRFEITDVYPGAKWKDTAITEFRGN